MKIVLTSVLGAMMGFGGLYWSLHSSSPDRQVSSAGSPLDGVVLHANAQLEQLFMKEFSDTQCADEWLGFLRRKSYKIDLAQMRPPLSSSLRPGNSDASTSFYAPTDVMGYWIELRRFPNTGKGLPGRVEIRELVPKKNDPSKLYKRITRWRQTSACEKTAKTKEYDLFKKVSQRDVKDFDDRNLRSLVKGRGKGLLYLWSPHMPYSYSSMTLGRKDQRTNWGVKTLITIAKQRRLPIEFLLDATSDIDSARKALKAARREVPDFSPEGIKRSVSLDLYLRMTGLHYPTLLYYSGGKIARNHLPGIASHQQIEEYIKNQERILGGGGQ